LKHFFTTNDVEFQLVPTHCHRRNAAERAIRAFKEHFVAGLSSVDPKFPLHLWDTLLPQAEITFNLLRTSIFHPQLSTSAHFHGLVDYNKKSFAAPGCKIISHEKPAKRRTWSPHGQHGYSFGPAMHQYRCQNVYISATASECIVDTLEFFPRNFQMPQFSSTDRLIMAANDMSNALKNPHTKVPLSHIWDDTITALTTLADIFKNKFQKVQIPRHPTAPAKVAERTFPAQSSNPILASPMRPQRQTRSQIIHAQDITNTPLLPRVVTPMTSQLAPPRVPRHSQNISPRNLSQDNFWSMDIAHMTIALGNIHWSHQHQANAVVHPITGKEMEYMAQLSRFGFESHRGSDFILSICVSFLVCFVMDH
jgi:hypothetical protein